MENKFTAAVIIAVALAALAGVFGYRLSRATDQNARCQDQVTTLEQENTQLKRQLDQLTASHTSLQRDYDALKAENENLQAKGGKPAKVPATH